MEKSITKLLNKLAKTREKFWNISPETGAFLNTLIRTEKIKTILEIGSSNGYSGIWLAEALSHNKGHLYTIESHKKERYGLALKNFQESGLTNITPILGHAPEDLPLTPKKFDLIFLDATKYEHLSYFEALKDRLKIGGLIITDNAISHEKDLKSYKAAVKNLSNWHSNLLNIGTGLFISQKFS